MEHTPEKRRLVHQIEQEDYAQEIKKLGEIKVKLHPAGGFDKRTGLVYEPIGAKNYVWKFKGFKGFSTSKLTETLACPSCGTRITYYGDKKKLKCSCGRDITGLNPVWKLTTKFENLDFEFEKEPLDKLIFNFPSKEAIDSWLSDYLIDSEKKEITEKMIFEILKEYFQTYFDFPFTEKESSIVALATIQSWLVEIMDTLFYISISGETGSGKTALGEALMLVSRHGFMANSISSSGIARCIEGLKLSIFFDEIDNKKHEKDEDISGILRQGYRRNNFFVRMHPKTFIPETFNTFGFKAFSFRSEIVDDLQNRSIEVTLAKTKDKKLPILNMFKKYNSPFNLLFFWYMDNIAYIFTQHPNFIKEMNELEGVEEEVNTVNTVNGVNVNNNNNNNSHINAKREALGCGIRFLLNYVNLINKKQIFGRNIELSFLFFTLCNILKIDLDKLIVDLIEEKQETELANEEEGWLGILKEVLVEEYTNVFQREDVSTIPFKVIAKRYIERIRGLYDNTPSQFQIKRFLRQIGFVDGLNKKVMRFNGKAMLGLVYDSEIKKNVGITKEEEHE
jgi:hypothetical protein